MAAELAAVSTLSPSKRIAVVTGGNKGIGLETCRQLASSSNDVVILTARDEKRGTEAVDGLIASGLSDIVFHQLDLMNSASIDSLADYIKCQFGKLDILINNAGVAGVIVDAESFSSLKLKPAGEIVDSKSDSAKKVAIQTYETAVQCLQTNYFGPKQLTEALLPLLSLSDSPRIVNVSSKLGQLENVKSETAKKTLSDIDELTEEKIQEEVNGFLEDAKNNVLEKKGWSEILSAYILSKAALNAYTRILAKKYPTFFINAVTPGFVKTDMSFHNGKYTVEEGARGPVKLALMPNGGPSGQFFRQTEDSALMY